MSAVDLDHLLPLLGEDGVLGLGEPTHGSANAFTWKFDLIHELAGRGLLAALAFEESFAVGRQVDAALQGAGDLDAAWDQGSSIWDTVTIRDGLRRLQAISATLPPARRPRFLGVDISKPYRTARALGALGHDAPVLQAVAARRELAADEVAELVALCRQLEARRQEHPGRRAVPPSGTAAPYDATVVALARNLRRHADAYLDAPNFARLHRRDTHMARTLLENLPSQGITVLWAHNEHLARNPAGWGGPTVGHVLDEELGARYVPVGVLCGAGECRAVDPSTGRDDYAAVPLPPLHPDTTDAALGALDVRLVTGAEFTHPGPRRFIGWQVDTSLFPDPAVVRETFEMARPSTDFAALAHLPLSIADVTAPPRRPEGHPVASS